MKRISLLVLVFSFILSAAFVPIDRATKVAKNQYNGFCNSNSTKSTEILNVVEHSYEGNITWYAFEFNEGFVIVSADDAVRPILGYSDHGTVPSADKPGGHNFKEWFENYDKQIAYVRRNNLVNEAGRSKWQNLESDDFRAPKSTIVVDRLVLSEWDQVWPWNDQCPLDGGDPSFVGCVATAMAQVLRYHRWPDVGVGSNNGYDFSSHTFNYDLMPYVLDIEYGLYPEYWEEGITQEEVDELALQSHWIGESVNMSYSAEGSSANMYSAATAYNNYWKASSAVRNNYSTPTGDTDLSFNIIKAELDAGRPWTWAGGVHAFVLDGYRDDHWYHFNWGWGGSFDGWFHRSYLVPDGTGAGGGEEGDYSEGQEGITYVPSTDPFTTWPETTLNGSLNNGCDVSLSWSSQSGAVEYEVYRTKNNEGVPTLITTTASTSFSDNELPEAEYSYHVIVVYSDGHSHNSNVYYVSVEMDPLYPVVKVFNGTVNGRVSIDLAWTKPFTGVTDIYEDFEASANIPDGWSQKMTSGGSLVDDDDLNNDWIRILSDSDVTWLYKDRIDGNFIIGSTAATADLWILAPPVTINSGHFITWWNRWRLTDDSGNPAPYTPYFEVVSYPGNFSDTNCDVLDVYDSAVDPENIWESENYVDLSSLNGQTTRIGFKIPVNANDLYTIGFDNITIGSTQGGVAEEPTGYEIYRNGSLATTIGSGTTYDWNDTGFIDGNNEYYLKALYSGGNSSLPSVYKTFTIDKDPVPGYLTGSWDDINSEADLSWYQPYASPPRWYSYLVPEECTTTIDNFEDGTNAVRRRTIFKALDLGFNFPITLDSVAIGFYDWDEGNWGGENTFEVRILTGGTYAINDTIFTIDSVFTAQHNKIITCPLGTSLVLNENFNVEITAGPNGYPGTLAALNPAGSHSYYYDTTFESYNYGMWNGVTWFDWLHMAYITSSDPDPIVKSGWTTSNQEIPDGGKKKLFNDVISDQIESSKGIASYNIYRNETYLDNTTQLTYTDTNPNPGDNTYYVTAVYTVPAGESAGSNEITIGAPPTISVPASISETVAESSTDAGSFNIDNSGLGDLHYTLDFDYTGYAGYTPGNTFHSEDFASQGNYSLSGFSDASGYLYLLGSKDGASGTATSPAFDTSDGSGMYLDFDQDFAYQSGSTVSVQYFNGSSWVQIYSALASTTESQHIEIPEGASNMQIRFNGYLTRAGGTSAHWQVDNIAVTGDIVIPYTWFDFTSALSGTVNYQSSGTINYSMDTNGLSTGAYEGTITVTSNDAGSPDIIPFTLNVGGSSGPDPVTGIVTAINGTNLDISWDPSTGASGYLVYSSADPYAETFDYVTTVPTESYSVSIADKMFYYFVATDAKVTSPVPKKIFISKPSLSR